MAEIILLRSAGLSNLSSLSSLGIKLFPQETFLSGHVKIRLYALYLECFDRGLFLVMLAPIPNFLQIGQKTQKLIIFAIGQFWLVGLVGRKLVVAISNSFYVVFGP